MSKLIKIFAVFLLVVPFFGSLAYLGNEVQAQGAQTINISGSPSSGALKGSGAGSQASFSSNFNVGSIPSSAQITSASVSLVQGTNALGTVSMSLIDNATTLNLGSKSLATSGVPKTHTYSGVTEIVKGWVSGGAANSGVTFTVGNVSNLNAADNISFSSISLSVTYSVEDSTAPVVSNVKVALVTEGSVWITWSTSEATLGVVDYGTSKSYGLAVVGSEYVVNHSVEISGLAPGTDYHYRLRNKDNSGNEAISQDFTFKTKGDPIPVEEGSGETSGDKIQPPQNLQFTLVQDGKKYSIHLYWEPSTSDNIKGYKIYRAVDDRYQMDYYAEVDGETFAYDDSNAESDKLYFYTIRAFSDEGEESNESNVLEVQIEQEFKAKEGQTGFFQNFWVRLIIFNLVSVAGIAAVYFGVKRLKRKGKKVDTVPFKQSNPLIQK